eukprot:scaffold22915_cov27-Tisochrysis_lutea.AAC.1
MHHCPLGRVGRLSRLANVPLSKRNNVTTTVLQCLWAKEGWLRGHAACKRLASFLEPRPGFEAILLPNFHACLGLGRSQFAH